VTEERQPRHRISRHREPKDGSRGWRLLAFLVLPLFALWILGLFWFNGLVPHGPNRDETVTDAIVVLTGGSARLDSGLALLEEKRAAKLFVSGVYRGVDVAKLLEISRSAPADLTCCITLGYEADDTRGNAIETARWMRDQNLKSLRLVTAAYHMPRSLAEFRHAMPDMMIVVHPVFPKSFKRDSWWLWPGSASLMISEYTKYLLAQLRLSFFDRPH
jgi:uncharacterized SAM-binding protein YcdF (DUF218 family)